MHKYLSTLIGWGALINLGFGADIVSVQAKMEHSRKLLDGNGNIVQERRSIDDYVRDSQGSIYQKKREIDPATGEVVHVTITVSKLSEGVQYRMNPETKQLIIETGTPKQPKFFEFPAEFERRTYLARTVVISPIVSGTHGKIGEAWVDEQSHLILYFEQQSPVQNMTQIRTMKTLEFVTGIEPDPSLFEIPRDYTIVEGAAPH